ncbi:MAG: helix-turn-helix domain-containing protein [Proteobacteria bacterium]|nr:helix-turn-helix domain-containing protein [Pseudomonadota bacterium]
MPDEPGKQDESQETRTGPGQQLRQAREAQGLAISQVAAELHLGEYQIDALESERFELIGAPVFVRGHLRNYALLLKLDSEQLLGHMQSLGTDPSPAAVSTEVEMAMQRDKRVRRISLAAGFVIVIGALFYVGLWIIERTNNLDGGEPAVTPQIAIPQAAGNDPAGDVEHDTPGAAASPHQLPAAAGNGEAVEASPEAGPPVKVALPTKRLTVRFNRESWIEAYDARGRRLIYEMGLAGSERTLIGVPPVEIFLGFADGVEILVDGEPFALQNARRRGNTAQITIESD